MLNFTWEEEGQISTFKIDLLLPSWNCKFYNHKGSHTNLNIWTINCSLVQYNSIDNLYGIKFRQGVKFKQKGQFLTCEEVII